MMYLAIAGASVDIDAHLDLCAQLSVAQTHTVPPAHPPPCNYILDDVACLKMDGQCTRMATKRNETKRNARKIPVQRRLPQLLVRSLLLLRNVLRLHSPTPSTCSCICKRILF
jgi:hypothetical protein